jgi:hypothetical protein
MNVNPKFQVGVSLPIAKARPTPDMKNYKRGYRIAKERMSNYTQSDINYFLACNRDSDPYAQGWRDALSGRKPKYV